MTKTLDREGKIWKCLAGWMGAKIRIGEAEV